jgi:hypothetical protein
LLGLRGGANRPTAFFCLALACLAFHERADKFKTFRAAKRAGAAR